MLLQTVVTLINLGSQRLGMTERTREARDPEQTRVAIEAVRSLLPLLESAPGGAEQLRPVRDALSQLQMAYAREVAGAEQQAPAREAESEAGRAEGAEEEPSRAARRSGRLWVPPGSTG